jgi:hypothetical protein
LQSYEVYSQRSKLQGLLAIATAHPGLLQIGSGRAGCNITLQRPPARRSTRLVSIGAVPAQQNLGPLQGVPLTRAGSPENDAVTDKAEEKTCLVWLVRSCCSHLEHRASEKHFVSLQFLNLIHSVGLLDE